MGGVPSRGRRKVMEEQEEFAPEQDVPRQCLGPGCVEVSRQGSKYCSDNCGLKLASK